MFTPLREVAEPFSGLMDWPDLAAFERAFGQRDWAIRPVAQDGKPRRFEDHYEPRIYLRGELQTRLRNWHDFFNALVWLRFPQTKSVLNRLHFQAAERREPGSNRSPIENVLTRFDECGAVLISADPEPLTWVREHRWRRLFWDERQRFAGRIRCVVFGHASFEMALTPFLGMTTNTLLVQAPQLLGADWNELDAALAEHWRQSDANRGPLLWPLPILGVPGWHEANHLVDFYHNERYFRPTQSGVIESG